MATLKKKLKLAHIHFFCLFVFFGMFFSSYSYAANLYVGNCYSGTSYNTIQAAINAASSGDTIYVCDGTYYENLSIINKSLSIVGYSGDPSKVIVQNSNNAYTVNINPSYYNSITFSNITFKNTSFRNVINFSNKPGSVTITNSRIEGNGFDILYFDKGIGSLSISNTSISNSFLRGIQINGSSDNEILIDNVSIDAKDTAFWITGAINNGFTIKNSTIKSQDKNGIAFDTVSGIFDIDNVAVKSGQGSIVVNGVINNGFNIKNSDLYSSTDKAIYFKKSVSNNIIVDSSKLEGYFGFWIDGNVINNDLIITNTSIQANSDVALKITNTAKGSIKISNSNVIATSNHAVQLNKIKNNLEILNSKIKSDANKNGVEVYDEINGNLKIENSEIHSGASALIIKKTISNNATIKSSKIISDNSKGAVFSDNIWNGLRNRNGLRIDNSTFIAKSNALDLQSSKRFNPYITNSYFESSDDTAVSANLQQWTSFNAQYNCFKTSGNNNNDVGLNLQITNSNNVNINNNCFYAPSITQLANSNREGYNWTGNYWDGLSGNSYNHNKILDSSPLSSCPNRCITLTAPVADYHFDECNWDNDYSTTEVKDSSANQYHGNSKNGPYTLDNVTAGGGIGRVGYFDGIDDYVEIPQAAADILRNTASLSFWIKTNQTGNDTTWAAPSVIGIEQDGGTDDIRWGWIDASGHIGVSKGNNGGNSKSNTRINDNQWHHVILTWNSDNGNIKIYIDGSLDKEGSTDTGVVGNAFNSIGRNENTNSSKSAVYFNGYLDEIKIYDKILTDSQVQSIYNYEKAGKNWDGTDRVKVNCLQLNQCFFDDFNRSSLGTKWTVIKNQNFTPTIEDNKLVLTKKINNVATGVTLAGKFPSQDNYIEIEFEHNAYDNPNGADGVTIALADAAVVDRLLSDNISDIAGAYGGSLGYAQRSGLHGFRGGWLGIGIDEYGNFANDNEGRGKNCQSHPPTYRVKDSITIRGTGDNETGYCFIANSGSLNPGVDNSTAKNYKYKISIDTRNNKTFIKVDRDILDGNGYQTIINWHDATQNATPPDNFKLSITGSTGSVTNIHSFDDLKISALSCGDLGQEIGYKYLLIDAPPTALTCQPADVKITACINDDCSQKYPNGVSGIELSATDGANWTMNPVSIPNGSYSVNTGLYKQTPGTTTLSITSATPSPSDTPIYKCSWDSNCEITFYDSGFIFDIADTYSYKPQDVTIKAVRKDDQTQACIPAFQNTSLDINFTFDNLSANPTNTAPEINNFTLPNNITLNFDNNGEATFNVVYKEAGKLSFTATYDNGTVYAVGSDTAVFRPFGYFVYTSDNDSQADNGANSTVFKKAGEEFNLSAKAVGWQSDTDTDLSDNPVTKNYSEKNISVNHTLVAPSGGNNGTIGVTSLDFTNGEASVDNQTFSEVGIITFTVTDDDYLGVGSITGTSANIGRFIPYNFVVENINNGTLANQNGNFNYLGQTTTYQDALRPTFIIRAVNKDNQTTTNYRGDYFKLDANEITLNYPATDNQTKGIDGNYLPITFDKASLTLVKGNGTGEVTFGYDNVTYDRNVNTLVNPFTPNFSIEITKANDGELSTDFEDKRVNVTGSTMYFGRLNIHNAYGSELDNVTAEVVTEYYDGSNWKIIEDNTTSIGIGHFILDNFTDNLNSGETTIVGVNSISRGVGGVTLSAPGENNEGSVDLSLDISTAPYYNWLNDIFDNESRGTVTFGIYRGRDRIIDWQEVPAR